MAMTMEKIRTFTYCGTGNARDVRWDSEVRGLGVRVYPSGRKSFVLRYRTAEGAQRLMALGDVRDCGLKEARRRARLQLGTIGDPSAPADPLEQRRAARRAPTVAKLAEEYAADYLPRKRASSQKKDRQMLDRFVLPALGDLRVAAVRRRDIERLHQSLAQTPYQANRVLALVSRLFSLAVAWEYRPDNPAKGVERFQEAPRARYLTHAEVKALSAALESHSDQDAANVVRLCLLTGARSGEVMAARWEQFGDDLTTWTKPAATTKQNRVHVVPLSAPARAVLAALPKRGPFLLPSRGPRGHRTTINKHWVLIREAAGLPDLRLHDLRHSFASFLASSGASLLLIGRMLGHTQPITTARYSHLLDDPLREAAERVGAVVAGNERAPIVQVKS